MLVLGNISLTYSLRKIDLNIITIVSSSTSIFFVILLSFFIIKEKISYSKLIGILMGTLGILLVII